MVMWGRVSLGVFGGIVAAALAVGGCDCGVAPTIAPPPDQIDVLAQGGAARVDVLFVVDNSSSMARKHEKVRARIGRYLDDVLNAGVDIHLGVVTTDPAEEGALRRFRGVVDGCDGCAFVDRGVRDPVVVVDDLLDVGVDGSSFEEGFTQALAALDGSSPDGNPGFVRADADLVVIFVSDEDEGPLQGGLDPRHVERTLRALKPAGDESRVRVGALVGFPRGGLGGVSVDGVCDALAPAFNAVDDDDNDPVAAVILEALGDVRGNGCVDESAGPDDESAFAELGGRYLELACRTGGAVGNLCDADYDAALGELALATSGLTRRFPLSAGAFAGGDDCAFFTADDLVLDCDDDGVIAPGPGAVDAALCVTARCEGDDEARALPLGVWTYDRVDDVVVFGGACVPAAGTDVVIRYGRHATACP